LIQKRSTADGGEWDKGPCGHPQASILVSLFQYILQMSFLGDVEV